MNRLPRRSGVLLHPTCLPGPHGAGDLGPGAYHFVDWLVAGRQTLWQVLPLGPVGPGNSPYMSPSAFAGNPLLIDLAQLRDAGWLRDDELGVPADFDAAHVNFSAVVEFRMQRLRLAAQRFFAAAGTAQREAYAAFCVGARGWLDDYALFMALQDAHGEAKRWQDWRRGLALREPRALAGARHAHAETIAFWKFVQWCFFDQWAALKAYANARGVEIVGDLPIFVAANGADIWSHPELFDLDASARPTVVAGVPPDYFSATGQHWGNPLYRWPAHAAERYRWWIARLRHTLHLYDRVRIDHFRGFEAYWEIPADAETAMEGRWQPGPGADLFVALRESMAGSGATLPRKIIAEDLGVITPAVTQLRESLGLPGMRVLQFAFDGKPDNPYLPHNFEVNTVVYTGTHDNDTTQGWWRSLPEHERDLVRQYFALTSDADIHWTLIRAAFASVAALAIVPFQDVLGLGTEHRMNRPGVGGAWEWRFSWDLVAPWHAERLASLGSLYGRNRFHEGEATADGSAAS
jgi:4-alpha-glucanotransferase